MAGAERTAQVLCIGTADTKLEELRFLADRVGSDLSAFSKGFSLKVLERFSRDWFVDRVFLVI